MLGHLLGLSGDGKFTFLADGAAGTCYASATVGATGCATREGITEQFLQFLEDLFGTELASQWEPPM